MNRVFYGCIYIFPSLIACPAPEPTPEPEPIPIVIAPSPSDDPAAYGDVFLDEKNANIVYTDPQIGEAHFVVSPDTASQLPEPVRIQAANNQMSITLFDGRLWMAWRTAPSHFATPDTRIWIMSSTDSGETWQFEHLIEMGKDIRVPQFYVFRDVLHLAFVDASEELLGFIPEQMWIMQRDSQTGIWNDPVAVGRRGEVPWDIKERYGDLYMTSYIKTTNIAGEAAFDVFFQKLEADPESGAVDGLDWQPVNPDRVVSYHGGGSEAGFEFAEDGSVWILLRNAQGDQSGFGSLLCHAPADNLSDWICPTQSNPERYDSPKLFRHGADIYAIVRRDVGGPFDEERDDLTIEQQRQRYEAQYRNRPKRTTLYKLNIPTDPNPDPNQTPTLLQMQDLPSAGDTGFAAIRRLDAHRFLITNYTSPLDNLDRSWLSGTESFDGTQIYWAEMEFGIETAE